MKERISHNKVKTYLDQVYEMTKGEGHKGRIYKTPTEFSIISAVLGTGALQKTGNRRSVCYKWMPTIAPTPTFVEKVLAELQKNAPEQEEGIASEITDEELFAELKKRGYKGNLTMTISVNI